MTLDEAVAAFTKELPGWWRSVGDCSVSAHASCGPEGQHQGGVDAYLLDSEARLPREKRAFDNGFHADLPQPSTPALALLNVLEQAKAAKAEHTRARHRHAAADEMKRDSPALPLIG
jgi:hypothetical protein